MAWTNPRYYKDRYIRATHRRINRRRSHRREKRWRDGFDFAPYRDRLYREQRFPRRYPNEHVLGITRRRRSKPRQVIPLRYPLEITTNRVRTGIRSEYMRRD